MSWTLHPFPDFLTPGCDRWIVRGLEEGELVLYDATEAEAVLIAAAPTLLQAAREVLADPDSANLARLGQAVTKATEVGRLEGEINALWRIDSHAGPQPESKREA